jgi:Domain of unknown function (DUF4157)
MSTSRVSVSRSAASPAVQSAGLMRDRAMSSGRPLERQLRATMERRFGQDFSGVRVHTGADADCFTRAAEAQAYTIGRDIVFRSGAYAPHTPEGRSLITHELTHVAQQQHGGAGVQQRAVSHPGDAAEREARGNADQADSAGSLSAVQPGTAVLHRSPLGVGLGIGLGVSAAVGLGFGIAALAGAFDGETFTDKELQDYLAFLQDNQSIEGKTKSDNKARAVVKRWKAGAAGFTDLIIPIRVLLIKEMASGYLSEGDQDGILDLIREAIPVERAHILSAIDIESLKQRFEGKRRKSLDAIISEQEVAGIGLSDPWTVPDTRKILERHGDGGIVGRVLRAGFKFFRFTTAFDKWKYDSDGHTEENEITGLQGNTDRRVSPKRIRLRESLTNEVAASTLYHEGTHAISPETTTQAEYLADETNARVEEEGFRYRHGMEPDEPSYRTAKGKPDRAAIFADVTGSPHYNPTNRKRVGRRYVGEVETTGWDTP